MKLHRTWALVPLGLIATLGLLLGTVTLGLRLRSAGDPDVLPNAAALDYGAGGFGAFSPLSASFIRDVLGGVIDLPNGAEDSASLRSARGVVPTSATKPLKRVEVTHALTNDDRADALHVPSIPFTARTDTRRATRESGETSACGPLRGGTVWYRYTPPIDVGLIANTFGSNYATTLGVFATRDGTSTVGCDTDVRGNSIVQFIARARTTYLFQIEAPAGGGNLVFNLDPGGVTTLESISRTGAPADAHAQTPSISGDGRLVAFASAATNLVPQDTNDRQDVFVRDRRRSTITRVSLASDGRQASDHSAEALLSGNGRYVAFSSVATNLVPRDTNGIPDVFVRDLRTGRTERVSVASSEKQAVRDSQTAWGGSTADNATSFEPWALYPTMSHDGRYVAFQSLSPNLVPHDTNHTWDVFVRDRVAGTTERVSVDSSGRQRGADTNALKAPNEAYMTPSISGNGRVVSFRTSASNLVEGDDNNAFDIFVHDRRTRSTERITASSGPPVHVSEDDEPRYAQNELRTVQALSFDGRFVAFSAAPRPTYGPARVNVFVHDRRARRTVQVNVSSTGARPEDGSTSRTPAISADGRYVAFNSTASNLVPGDDNEAIDVFVRDLRTRTTVRLTTLGEGSNNAACADCGSSVPAISADGRVVAFESTIAPAFVRDFGPDANQIYVNERPPPAR